MGRRTAASIIKKSLVFLAFTLIPLILGSKLASAGLLIPTRVITVHPANLSAPVTLSGQNWAYTVHFPVHNVPAIEKLIQCESSGLNVSRPDSNGLVSDGILQFNRDGTWQDMEQRFGFRGDPRIPANAIHMADIMIDAGLVHRWTCAKILSLIP